MQYLNTLKNIIFKNFKYFLLFLILAPLLLIALFPYDDLTDFITAQVSKSTRNKIHLTMDGFGFSLFPSPSLTFENLAIESAKIPHIQINQLNLAPSLLKLFTAKVGLKVSSSDFYGSQLQLNLNQEDKIETDKGRVSARKEESENKSFINDLMEHQFHTVLNLQDFSLTQFSETFTLPVKLNGEISLGLDAKFDPELAESPNGEFDIQSQELTIYSPTVPTQMGEITLPDLNFKKVSIKGRLVNNELIAEEMILGADSDILQVKIQGKINLNLDKRRGKIIPNFSNYDVKVFINLHNSQISTFYFLQFLDEYKHNTAPKNRTVYQFKATGRNFRAMGNIRKLSTF